MNPIPLPAPFPWKGKGERKSIHRSYRFKKVTSKQRSWIKLRMMTALTHRSWNDVIKKVRCWLKSVDKNAGILRCALTYNIAMATSLSGLGNDGRRSRWNFCTNVQIPSTQGSANGSLKSIFISNWFEPLCYRHLNFDELIRHQFQALSFGYLFIKKKVEAIRRPAEASLCSGKQPLSAYRRTFPLKGKGREKKHSSQLSI